MRQRKVANKLKAPRKEVGEKNQIHKQINVRFRSVRKRLMLLKLQSETRKKNSKNENGKEKNRRDCRKHAMHGRQTKETHMRKLVPFGKNLSGVESLSRI